MWIRSSLILSLLLAACSKTSSDTSRYHEDGRAKPVVAICSMIDVTSFDCAWSLSEEFTSMIAQNLSKNGSIFVGKSEDLGFTENPFGTDLAWMKREFPDQEFAVFMELVEHQLVPTSKPRPGATEVSMNLNMGVRLRVVDLRPATPKLVLQEMVRNSYYIPKTLIPTDYNIAVWGTDEFRRSPMGVAHIQLVDEIVSRLNDYILLAKSR